MITFPSNFSIYFNEKQQQAFQNCEITLQNFISQTLLESEQPNDIKAARLILNALELWDKKEDSIKEIFFLTLLKSNLESELLQKVNDILLSGLKDIFFQCAMTQKKEYYSIEDLTEMINIFHQILSCLPKTHPPFTYIPTYHDGGKEVLLNVLKNPKDLIKLLQKGFISPDSTFTITPPPKFKNILSQSFEFNQFKKEITRYLTSLGENNRLKMDVYLKFFKKLENTTLHSLEKSEVLKLVLITTTSETVAIQYAYTIHDFEELMTEAEHLHEYGEEQLLYFCSAKKLAEGAKLEDVILAFKYLNLCYRDNLNIENVQTLLVSFYNGGMNFSAFLKSIESLVPYQTSDDVEDSISIESLMDRFSGKTKDPNVQFPLSPDDLLKVKNQYLKIQEYCRQWKNLRICDLVNKALEIHVKAELGQIIEEDILSLYAIGRLAIRTKFKIYLYNTQVCADLALDLYPKGLLGQIKTGEGKSMVGTLFGFVRALSRPRQGHIVSSDRKLAKRDHSYFQEFFQIFNISTSHICEDQRDVKHFQARLLYGTATDFEFALMREMLYGIKLFPDTITTSGKRFSWILVDEVDNLTIDTSRNGARLSFQAEVTYDWVYVPIFNFVKSFFQDEHTSILPNEILPKIKKYLKKFRDGIYTKDVDKLTDKKLIEWIQSAYQALYKKTIKNQYVIGFKETQSGERVKGILIVDSENTGRIAHGSRWSNGIHEFVEVKENLDVQAEKICPISMNHPVLYSMYETLNGISGTIGNEIDRKSLYNVYGIKSFDVPTHHPSQRIDLSPVIFETTQEYLDAIVQLHLDCKKRGQPVLNLNQTIQETEDLAKIFKKQNIPFEILNEIQKEDEDLIIAMAGLPGTSVIATNTATRGTDIKLTPLSLTNGGLFVIISYYPENVRIEMQGRGRSGRQGQRGMSVIYLSKEKLAQEHPEIVNMTKKQVIEFLEDKRKERAMIQKDTQLSYAKIDRYVFTCVRLFYQKLNSFREISMKDSFNEMIASYLNGHKLRKVPEKDYSHLSSKNQQIVNDAIKCLTNLEKDCTLSWKVLVEKITDRICLNLINQFALNFQAQVNEIVNESGLISFSEREKRFKQQLQFLFSLVGQKGELLKEIDEQLEKIAEKDFDNFKNNIKEIFEENMMIWADYLDPSGRGIMKYLSEILDYDLNPPESDNYFPSIASKSTKKSLLDYHHDHDLRSLSRPSSKSINNSFFELKFPQRRSISNKLNLLEINKEDFSVQRSEISKRWFDIEDIKVDLPPYVPGTPLPPPSETGSQIPLVNYGNTCWLNSVLKFIACTTFYDEMLKEEVQHKRLQGFIRTIIISLRTNKEIDEIFFKAFLNELKNTMPDIPIGAQNDAPEFLMRLFHLLEWKPVIGNKLEKEAYRQLDMFPRLVMTYQPLASMPIGWTKYPMINNFQPEITVTIPNNYGNEDLDLALLINEAEHRSIKPDRLLANVPNVNEMDFLTTNQFITLPDVMMIYLKRAISDGHASIKVNNLIKLNSQKLIEFKHHEITYKEVEGKPYPDKIIPKESRYYRIGAAIVHIGNIFGEGHYECLERGKNGDQIVHNDDVITTNHLENFGANGYFLRLDRVK